MDRSKICTEVKASESKALGTMQSVVSYTQREYEADMQSGSEARGYSRNREEHKRGRFGHCGHISWMVCHEISMTIYPNSPSLRLHRVLLLPLIVFFIRGAETSHIHMLGYFIGTNYVIIE